MPHSIATHCDYDVECDNGVVCYSLKLFLWKSTETISLDYGLQDTIYNAKVTLESLLLILILSLLVHQPFQAHLHHRVQLELALQLLRLQLDIALAHVHRFLHLRGRFVPVTVVLLCCRHRKLQIVVGLDVGSEHKATLATVYPRGLWLHL